MPALHSGYVDLFNRYSEVKDVRVIDETIVHRLDYLRKDVRALSAGDAVKALTGLGRFNTVRAISVDDIRNLTADTEIIMPDDDVSADLIDSVLSHQNDSLYGVFLRWNRNNVESQIEVRNDGYVDYNQVPVKVRNLLESEPLKSTDWWRRIGAVLCQGEEVLLTSFNKHIPTQYTPYIDGDMRMSLNRGAGIELIGSEHAEAGVLALAASCGINTSGLHLYTSTFPCPPCAKFIASAGIEKLFYQEGYAMGNGMESLEAVGVQVVQITNWPKNIMTSDQRPYPERPKS